MHGVFCHGLIIEPEIASHLLSITYCEFQIANHKRESQFWVKVLYAKSFLGQTYLLSWFCSFGPFYQESLIKVLLVVLMRAKLSKSNTVLRKDFGQLHIPYNLGCKLLDSRIACLSLVWKMICVCPKTAVYFFVLVIFLRKFNGGPWFPYSLWV